MNQPKIENLSDSRKKIIFTSSWDEWKKFVENARNRLSKDVKVDGFRPGKAPREFIEQRLGKVRIITEAASDAIREIYRNFLETEKMEALGEPKAEIIKADEEKELEFSIETDVIPEVILENWRGAAKKINLDFKDKKVEAEDVEVDKEIKHLADSRAKSVAVNREAKIDDQVEVDFSVIQNGVVIENGTGKNHPLILGKGVFIPGFEEAIVGMKSGESKEFELKFPEDYHNKNLAGKLANFKVSLISIQERIMPELNDEFAKSLGKFENIEELKNKIKDGILEEKKHKLTEEKREKFLEAISENLKIEIPQTLKKAELEKMVKDFEAQVAQWGMNPDDYLLKMGKTRDELESAWREQAEKRIKNALVLEKIAAEEQIEVKSESIEEEMNKTLQYYRNVKDIEKKMDMNRLHTYIKGTLINEEVFKLLEKM
jgi:trigger factor